MHRLVGWPGTVVFAIGAMLAGCSQTVTSNPDADAGRTDAATDVRRSDVTMTCQGASCDGGTGDDSGEDMDAAVDDVSTDDDAMTVDDTAGGTDDDVQTPPDDTGNVSDDVQTIDDTGSDQDVVVVDDTPPPDDSGNGGGPTSVLPPFDNATDQHVRQLVALGQSMGNSHDVFAKVGDSITESASFLFDCGYGWGVLGDHPEVGPTINYFAMHVLDSGRNSMNRASICAVGGWTSGDALQGSPDALDSEIDAIHPQWAVVMYGTNDIDRSDLPTYTANMNTILSTLESHGIVPIISTIPPRLDTPEAGAQVASFNDTVRGLASSHHIPLIDFWLALQPLPGYGMNTDGIHPESLNGNTACDFTAQGLQFGYNMRNLTALQMLERLRTSY